MQTILTRSATLFVLLLLVSAGAPDAQAQLRLGAHTGYNLDAPNDDGVEEGAFLVGGQARFQVARLPVVLNPSATYHLTGLDNTSLWQFDANVLYPFGTQNAVFTPYAGLGLAVSRISTEADVPLVGEIETDQTDYGLNVLGGITFGNGLVQPFAQAKITLGNHAAYPNEDAAEGSAYALTGGFLFRLGQ